MLCALVAAAALTVPAPAAATAPHPAPQTTVNAIEAEVMCPICGTLLELAESPQARREKVFVAKLVAAGKGKAEVKDALIAQYGPSVLALPKASGFDLSAYLVPILAIAIAMVVLAFSVLGWRRSGRESQPSAAEVAADAPQGEDAERLEADLSRYDL
ncbi:MAG TPA: cytochrome c-type biogenesis protein CcmH [Solirubrobacterales bacterium]|nr:cytochrome c-type biogenesis protein CcmH [Solirubrobacterales bacterium]